MKRWPVKIFAALAVAACACAIAINVANVTDRTLDAKTTGEAPSQVTGVAYGAADSVSSDEAIAQPQSKTPAVTDRLGEYQPGYVLVDFADGVSSEEALSAFSAHSRLAGTSIAREGAHFAKLALPAGLGVEEALNELIATGLVAAAQPNYLYTLCDNQVDDSSTEANGASASEATDLQGQTLARTANLLAGTAFGDALAAQATANDPHLNEQWSLASANVFSAWDTVTEEVAGKANASEIDPVVIAVIDRSFDMAHPDLAGNISESYNAATRTEGALSADADPSSQYRRHGTHVAGIVAAQTNNGIGVAGSTFNLCKIMPISLLESDGSITTETLVTAYEHVLERKSAGCNVRVANLSVGAARSAPVSSSTDPMLYFAIDQAYDAGIVTVAAACNAPIQDENGKTCGAGEAFYAYPSDYDQVVSVINLQENKANVDGVERASNSNYNTTSQLSKDIAAPGHTILSTTPNDTYGNSSGTSMASPLVSGVMGLMFTTNPQLTPDEAVSKLYSAARDLTSSSGTATGWDRTTGYGEVDAAEAVSSTTPYLAGRTVFKIGETAPFSVKIDGAVATGWQWASSDEDVAVVDEDGVLHAKGAGQAIVSAVKGAQTAYQTITVVDQVIFRLYNRYTGAHLYTTELAEYIHLASVGWRAEGVAWTSPTFSATPVYRLYNQWSGDHHYTTNALERSDLIRIGWADEGISWYSAGSSGIPLYRLFNPYESVGTHHYTSNLIERAIMIANGWRDEGAAWYALS